MATMYVYNIPTNETVNLRKTPGSTGTILVRVGYGKAVEASYYNATWHSATYNGYSGYIMSKYLTSTNPNGNGGNTGTGTGTPTAGIIKGTSVRVRKEPNTTSEILTQVNTGDKVTFYAGESYSGSSYNWYRCTSSKWSGNGYIATNYVVKDDGSTSSGDSDYAIRATVDTVKHGVGGTLNMRASASSGSSVVTTISNGATIYVKSMSGEWLAAKYNGYTGYVMAKFVVGTDAYGNSSTTPTPSSALDDVRNGKATIRLNDTGAAVVEIRNLLQSKGISIDNTTSTTFDQNMKTAVINFQNQYSVLGSDGIVGQCTLAVLEDTSDSTSWFVEGKKGTCKLTAGKLVLCGFIGPYVISPDHVNRLNKAINNADFNFTSKVQIRHFPAQGRKECDSGNTMTEYIYSEGSNANYGGFYGAGFMQLTGENNYKAFHNWLESASGYGADSRVTTWRTATKCVANNYPMVSAAWYFSQHNTDKDINNVIMEYWNSSVDTTVKKVTALVQGGTGSWEQRRDYYNKIKSVLL